MSDQSAFEFTGEYVDIPITTFDGKRKKVEAGVYHANRDIERADGQDSVSGQQEKFVWNKDFKYFILLEALKERLDPRNKHVREDDYKDPKRFKLWSTDGTLNSIPRTLIPTTKAYDDGAQLRRWGDFASKLGGKPSDNINPVYARFHLKPGQQSTNIIVYFTPSESPVCGIDVAALTTIVSGSVFPDWPNRQVLEYSKAKERGLKIVGVNFFQFYVTWMSVSDYGRLWQEWKVTALPLSFPTGGVEIPQVFKNIQVKKSKSGVDGTSADITSAKLNGATGGTRKSTQSIMGLSATSVANDLWGRDSPTSGMGKGTKAEWLHKIAFMFGGLGKTTIPSTSDDAGNLVFGTWECNTDMIRTENTVKAMIQGDKNSGSLSTMNRLSGQVSRRGLSLANGQGDIPAWFQKSGYSWLCFQLDYCCSIPASSSPLKCDLNAQTYFEPWSLYVPLHIEPRLDIMVLNYLKTRRATISKDSPASSSNLTGTTSDPSSIPPPLPLPVETFPILAWRAARNGLPLLELPGLVISHPTVQQPPQVADPVPSKQEEADQDLFPPEGGFVLGGDVNRLFGTTLTGRLERWTGPNPDGIVSGSAPIIERVKVLVDIHMSTFFPLLQGSPFDKIIFRNVVFFRQNGSFDKTKTVGWHLNADWIIDSSCGLLHNILTQTLRVNNPTLSVHAVLGEQRGWQLPLNLHSFTLEGTFPNLTLSLVPGLSLTSVGVRLKGIRGFTFSPTPRSTLSYGFGIFGTMKLNIPGSVTPLDLSYEMGLTGSTVILRAEVPGRLWTNAFGVQNLELEDTLFSMALPTSSPRRAITFDVSATFWHLTSRVSLTGSYVTGGQFSLKAEFNEFGTEQLESIFFTLFSDSLSLPNFDVYVGSATLSIVSGKGLSISLHNFCVADYEAPDVNVTFTSSGAILSGALLGGTLSFEEVRLRRPMIQLAFGAFKAKKRVDFMLSGMLTVDFLDADTKAIVHLYPGRQGKFAWAVVAEFSSQKSFAISNVVHDIKGTFLDLSLNKALFVAASEDNLAIEEAYSGYKIHKGVQFFGIIDRIPPLNALLNRDVTTLIFRAGWSRASGFNLAVHLPAESSLNLGNGLRTKPISLAIRTKPVELAIIAGLIVPVQNSPPLEFSFVLASSLIGASASAEMLGWWDRPFGIDGLRIGPTVALSIEIIYAQFISTGTPSGFGLAGGLQIGQTVAHMALNVSEEPRRQMLSARAEKLSASDIVTFAGNLIGQAIPPIPANFLKFEELKIYICPFGIVMGTVSYPQGFSFRADMVFLGKKAEIECTIDKTEKSIVLIGGIQNFELGPLVLRGSKGPRAEVDCSIGVLKQRLFIDGVVSLFDQYVQTHVDIQLMPTPNLKFFVLLKLAKLFMFQLDAELIGSLGGSLRDSNFRLHAVLKNNIIQYIARQVVEQFEGAKTFAKEGLNAAEKKVQDAEKEWKALVTGAEKKLDEARRNWESHDKQIRSTSEPVINSYLSEISRLQDNIEKARKAFDSALKDAQRAVDQANRDRGAALAAATRDVEQAKRDMDKGITEAQRALDSAQADLSAAFGSARRAIDNAQWEIWSLQNQINSLKRTISEYERAPWYHFWKKGAIPGLWASVWVLEASKAVASGALDAARAVLLSAEYLSKEAAVSAARYALAAARETGRLSLSVAQGALTAADETSKFAVDRAKNALEGVKKGAEYAAFEGAKQALELFKKANEAAYKVAVKAIEALVESAAFVAFTLAKVGLKVAKTSTALLDGAKEALALAKKATSTVLEILRRMAQHGATALGITKIELSGSITGISGGPFLSATVEGNFLGRPFSFKDISFTPKTYIAFFESIFKKLWDWITGATNLSFPPHNPDEENEGEIQSITVPLVDTYQSQTHTLISEGIIFENTRCFTLTRKQVALESELQWQESSEIIDESMTIFIPCGPFTGIPIASPEDIIELADRMAQKNGLWVKRFGDVKL